MYLILQAPKRSGFLFLDSFHMENHHKPTISTSSGTTTSANSESAAKSMCLWEFENSAGAYVTMGVLIKV